MLSAVCCEFNIKRHSLNFIEDKILGESILVTSN